MLCVHLFILFFFFFFFFFFLPFCWIDWLYICYKYIVLEFCVHCTVYTDIVDGIIRNSTVLNMEVFVFQYIYYYGMPFIFLSTSILHLLTTIISVHSQCIFNIYTFCVSVDMLNVSYETITIMWIQLQPKAPQNPPYPNINDSPHLTSWVLKTHTYTGPGNHCTQTLKHMV